MAENLKVYATVFRNWKIKSEGIKNMGGDDGFDLIWHIDRAKFYFDDPEEYEAWKKDKKVFFEFSPSQSDDCGQSVFADAGESGDYFEVTPDRGVISISLEDDGPEVSAWVQIKAKLIDELDEETLSTWSGDEGGWASCSISLGPYDAFITEDYGGDWRLPSDEP